MSSDGIYPITMRELEAAETALREAEDGGASTTSRVHAVLGAIDRSRSYRMEQQ